MELEVINRLNTTVSSSWIFLYNSWCRIQGTHLLAEYTFSEPHQAKQYKQNSPQVFKTHQDTEMLIPETLNTILQTLGLQETHPITWQLQENGNLITITLNMIKSSAKPVAPVNCVTLFDRPNYKTQSKTKYKSPSTRRRDQQRFDAFLLKKGTQVATQVPGTRKTEQEQLSVKRVVIM